jgi:hypothetical protein
MLLLVEVSIRILKFQTEGFGRTKSLSKDIYYVVDSPKRNSNKKTT